jgi:hypothetical protein
MSFVITFCTVSMVFFLFLGLFKGVKSIWDSIPEDDGTVERSRTLKKQVKESLESYHGKYKVRNLWSPDSCKYLGKLYCKDYDFGIPLKADCIDEFLDTMEKAIHEDAWAKRMKRLENLSPEERREKQTEPKLITVFSISFIVFLIALPLLLSEGNDSFYTILLTITILSFLTLIGSVIMGIIISRSAKRTKAERSTHDQTQGQLENQQP